MAESPEQKLRPLHDWLLVELEPSKETVGSGIIVRVGENPVRFGKVLAVGPGRRYQDKYVPTSVEVGERVVFFIASTDTMSGRMITHQLPDNQRLIRETDVLFVTDEDIEVSV